MQKPRKVEVKCIGLNEIGQGLVKIDGRIDSVPYLLPKEEALVEINTNYKYNRLKVIKLLKTSPLRENTKCDIYQKCGGCHLLHMKYQNQIDFKRDYVLNSFKDQKINVKIDEVIKANKLIDYRNKMQVSYRYKDNRIIYGFYEEETHRVVPLENCLVQTSIQNEITKYVQVIMMKMKLQPYNEDKRSGLIRFVLVKEAFQTKQVMVVIVTNSDIFPGRSEFVKQLRMKFPQITTIVQNINSRATSVILGDSERILYGNGYIEDYLCDIKFKISSKTFFQINPVQTEKLYSKIVEYVDFKGEETIVDAYCGVGTIGLILAKFVKNVIGVENNKQSIINAIENSKDNKIKNLQFVNDDATDFIEKLAKDNANIDAIIMDPPRSGSTERFLKAILKLKPSKVIYVSCEAKTLARDLKLVIDQYYIKKCAIVDMFVGTYHVESIVLLERR